MDDRDGWRERVKELCAVSVIWWWWWWWSLTFIFQLHSKILEFCLLFTLWCFSFAFKVCIHYQIVQAASLRWTRKKNGRNFHLSPKRWCVVIQYTNENKNSYFKSTSIMIILNKVGYEHLTLSSKCLYWLEFQESEWFEKSIE